MINRAHVYRGEFGTARPWFHLPVVILQWHYERQRCLYAVEADSSHLHQYM